MPSGRNVRMLRTENNFVSIAVENAVYCDNCATVSNSDKARCGVCGSSAIQSLVSVIYGPPINPDPGPAAPAQIVPIFALELLSAA
jgi:hypothetical protein